MSVTTMEAPGACSILTVSDLAQFLKVSERKVRYMMKHGALPRPKVLGKRGFRWLSTDLDKFLQEL